MHSYLDTTDVIARIFCIIPCYIYTVCVVQCATNIVQSVQCFLVLNVYQNSIEACTADGFYKNWKLKLKKKSKFSASSFICNLYRYRIHIVYNSVFGNIKKFRNYNKFSIFEPIFFNVVLRNSIQNCSAFCLYHIKHDSILKLISHTHKLIITQPL